MPRFETLPLGEAQVKSASGKRAQVIREYVAYVAGLQAGQAGRLQAGPGETLNAVRRRLGAGAKAAGKKIIIKRTGTEIYFWVDGPTGKRRGRKPKIARV